MRHDQEKRSKSAGGGLRSRAARWLLTRGRIPYLALLAAITAALGLCAAKVDVEQNNESLTTRDESQAAVYARFKRTFGSDEDMLLALEHPHLLERDGLRFLSSLTERIATIDGVRHVYSLANAKQVVASDTGGDLVEVVDADMLESPHGARRLSAALDANPALTALFVSADRKTAGILVEIEDRPNTAGYPGSVIDALRALQHEPQETGVALYLTGVAVQKHDVTVFVDRDQKVLIPLALVVLGAMLASFFRRGLGVALPLAVTGITVVWTLGLYGLAGLRVNAITALLPPILMVLSLAVSIHLVQGWSDAPSDQRERIPRILAVVRTLWFPCFFCALTTAFGFGSLLTNTMPAVQQFGLFAAIGTLISFVVGITLVPVGLTYVPAPRERLASTQHRLVRRVLEWSADQSSRHPWRIVGTAAALTVAALAGLPLVRNNTDLVRFLKSDAELHRDTMFIDTHLTGANTLEYVVRRHDGQPLTGLEDVQRMAAFEKQALAREYVTGVGSVLPLLRQIEHARSGGDPAALPASQRDTSYAFDLIEAAPERDLLSKLISGDFTQARFNVRLRAVGTAESAPVAEAITADAKRIFGGDYEIDVTGAFYHIVEDSNRLVRSQIAGFASALVFVLVTTGLAFRSFVLIAIAVVAYVVPLVWTGGLMGVAAIDLSTGTAMIASAVLGMVVDDTIHYLAHFVRVLRDDVAAAARETTLEMGAALMTNNLVQVLGFWVGCFGSFKPTIYFSLMSGITMISALLCDLLVTPALLVLAYRRRGLRTNGARNAALLASVLAACTVCAPVCLAAGGTRGSAAEARTTRPDAGTDDALKPGGADTSVAAAWQEQVPPELSALFDTSRDETFDRRFVPSLAKRVGEVRLIRRGDTDVVQTLLYSKLLARVVAEIHKKELRGWPPTREGYADALHYLFALDQAGKRLWDEVPLDDRRADRRQKMIIELAIDAKSAAVFVGGFEMDDRGEVRVTERRPFFVWSPARTYVERNMGLIVADSFELRGPALVEKLAAFRHVREPGDVPPSTDQAPSIEPAPEAAPSAAPASPVTPVAP